MFTVRALASGRSFVLTTMSTVVLAASSTLPQAHPSTVGPTVGPVRAVGAVATSQSSSYVYEQWATPDPVSSYVTPTGQLAVLRRSTNATGSLVVTVQRYTASSLAPTGSATRVTLSGWSRWGGFYQGPDGYSYVLVGRPNTHQNDAYPTVAVRRYDRNWRLVGVAYVRGGASQEIKGIYEPFDAGSARMALVAGRLVVHMSRSMYAIGGVHHQADLTFEVRPQTMTAVPFQNLGGAPYSSHSFAQFVVSVGSTLVLVDHGDAYPRGLQVSVVRGYPTRRTVSSYVPYRFAGATGDNFTGTSITDTIAGPGGVDVLGTSTGHSGRRGQHRNLLLVHVDPATGHSSSRFLTAFPASGGSSAGEPRAVRVGTDRYAVLFEVTRADGGRQMEYRLISSAGRVLASRAFRGGYHSSISEPVLVGRSIVWVGVGPSGRGSRAGYLYALNVRNPAAPAPGLAR